MLNVPKTTSDKGIKDQQTMEGRSIAVGILRAPNNRLETHRTVVPEVIRVLTAVRALYKKWPQKAQKTQNATMLPMSLRSKKVIADG